VGKFVLVLVVCLAAWPAWAAADMSAVKSEEALVARGLDQARGGQTDDAIDTLNAALRKPQFQELSEQEQYQVCAVLGRLLSARKDPAALSILKRVTQYPEVQKSDWHLRLEVAYVAGDYRDSVISFTAIVQRWPQDISGFNDRAIFRLGNLAPKISDEAGIALLAPLHNVKWRPSAFFDDPDRLWYALALAYLNKQDQDSAADVLNDVSDADLIIEIRSDKRFDAAVAQDPAHFDFARRLASEVSRQRFLVSTAPKKLEGIVDLTNTLIKANQPRDALETLDQTIARALPGDTSPSRFEDYDEQMGWLLNQRARTLILLGRDEEGLDAYGRSVSFPVNEGSNVGQTINYAGALTDLGKAKQALDVLVMFDPKLLNDYGRMSLAKVRACAYAELGDKSHLAREVEFVKAHSADSSRQLIDTLVCANDTDGVAQEVLARLADPHDRGDILFRLQDFIVPENETAIDKDWRLRFAAVRNRPDVAAAIARVGRIASYSLLQTGF